MATKMKPGNNGYDPDKVQQVASAYEAIDGECETIMGEARSKCKTKRSDQKDILDQAKDAYGIPKGEMKTVLQIRKLERRADRLREDRDPESQDEIDKIRQALGDLADTPLGQAAQ